MLLNYLVGSREEGLPGAMSRVILEISQPSGPRDICQIRAGREKVVLTGEGVLHDADLGKDWQAMADCNPEPPGPPTM